MHQRTTEAAQFLRLAISAAQSVVTFAFPVAFAKQLKNEPISSAQETRPPRFRPDVRILKCSLDATLLPMMPVYHFFYSGGHTIPILAPLFASLPPATTVIR